MRVMVLNGPNLDLLGAREPEIYGTTTLADLEDQISAWSTPLGIEPSFRQSNHEGDLVDAIHEAKDMDGIVINAAALTHTSRSIGDAIGAIGVPAVEVHISNIAEREAWRRVSLVSDACVMTIYGRGMPGYRDALRHLVNRASVPTREIRYGPHAENVADLRRPASDPAGLVMLVHGGFWLRQYQRDSMETLAVDLTRRGFATLNVEYRRLGQGGGWPGSAHDVLTAVRSTARLEDLSRLTTTLIGHSAGGHLALWSAARHRRIGLVVGLAPVTDLIALADSGGGGAGPARVLLDSGAPERLPALPGATLLVHGESDDLVPASHSTRLADDAEIQLAKGLGHFEMLDPSRPHWPAVVEAIEKTLG
jgi:3-dehydroquinate dehydratase type II